MAKRWPKGGQKVAKSGRIEAGWRTAGTGGQNGRDGQNGPDRPLGSKGVRPPGHEKARLRRSLGGARSERVVVRLASGLQREAASAPWPNRHESRAVRYWSNTGHISWSNTDQCPAMLQRSKTLSTLQPGATHGEQPQEGTLGVPRRREH